MKAHASNVGQMLFQTAALTTSENQTRLILLRVYRDHAKSPNDLLSFFIHHQSTTLERRELFP